MPRQQLVRYAAVALLPVALALAAINSFFYPTSDPSELGWWATPVGNAVSFVAAVVGLPAVPVVLIVGSSLAALGLSEGWAFVFGAVMGSFVAALFWGWLAAVTVRWLRSHRAV